MAAERKLVNFSPENSSSTMDSEKPLLHFETSSINSVQNSSMEKLENVVDAKKPFTFWGFTRFIILFLAVICVSCMQANTLTLNFTIICMVKQLDGSEFSNGLNGTIERTTVAVNQKIPAYNKNQESWLFSMIAIGILAGTYPGSFLLAKFGTRKSFTVFGIISAFATIFSPIAAGYSYYALLGMRFLQGFASTLILPVQGTVTSQWAPLSQTGLFIAWQTTYLQIYYGNFQFGSLLTMPLAGAMCVSSFGWPGVFYIQGFVTMVAFAGFYLVYRDVARIHPMVSRKESNQIELGKVVNISVVGKQKIRDIVPVPYSAILQDIHIWAIIISMFGGYFAFQLLMQYGPIYINKVLGYEIESTGFTLALPYLLSLFIKFTAGPLSDNLKCLSEKTRIQIFNFFARVIGGFCFIALAAIPTQLASLAQVAYTMTIAFSGLNSVGTMRSAQLVARQHTHFLMTIFSVINCGCILFMPIFVGTLAPTNEPGQWSFVFYLTAGVVLSTTLFFVIFFDVQPAHWTLTNIPDNAKTSIQETRIDSMKNQK